MRPPRVSRRTLLIGGGAGVGLIVAFLAWPREDASPLRPAPKEGVLGPYLRVASDGRVTLAVPQAETGQGSWTGLAQIAADELGAAWENMAVEPAPLSPIYANELIARQVRVSTRITAGSTSIRAFARPLREAAAVARTMLCAAAADRWGVSAAECETEAGFVVHEGKRLGFGELAGDASGRQPPAKPILRAPGSGRIAGEALPRLDLAAKSDGSLRFASDVRLPRMLFASLRIASPGGRLTGFSRSRAGVDIVARDNWIAALGETWWAADHALSLAAPKFTGPKHAEIGGLLAEALQSGASQRIFERGDYAGATEGSRPLAATYSIAATPHRSLEAPAAVARFSGDRLEVWVGTQVPDLARAAAADAAGLPKGKVTLYPMPIGDGSGRAIEVEAVAMAVELARHAGRPVSLAYPPVTAQNHDPVRAPLMARMAALPSPDGTIAAWSARLCSMAGLEASLARALGQSAPDYKPAGAVPPYGIPAIRIDATSAALPIRAGYMRGGDEALTCFATESFIDEMARAAGSEPLAYRIGMLGGSPRLARALTTATAIGGWDGGGKGSSMGLACASL
jgi:isoquinoline 1-oxidoreductase beta subunit